MLFTTDRTFCPLNFASTELRLIEVSGPFLTLKYITSTICYDPTDKTVAVIGNDASGIQLVAELQKVVKHMTTMRGTRRG